MFRFARNSITLGLSENARRPRPTTTEEATTKGKIVPSLWITSNTFNLMPGCEQLDDQYIPSANDHSTKCHSKLGIKTAYRSEMVACVTLKWYIYSQPDTQRGIYAIHPIFFCSECESNRKQRNHAIICMCLFRIMYHVYQICSVQWIPIPGMCEHRRFAHVWCRNGWTIWLSDGWGLSIYAGHETSMSVRWIPIPSIREPTFIQLYIY